MSIKKVLLCGDSHGYLIDPVASEALLRFKATFKPDIIVNGGDLVDLPGFRKGASLAEETISIEDDLEACKEFNKLLFADLPKHKISEKKILMGNHEVRLWRDLESPVAQKAFVAKAIIDELTHMVKELKADFYPYDGEVNVCPIGDYNIIHGIKHNRYAANSHGVIFNNVIHFHTHTMQAMALPNIGRYNAFTCPCLASIDKLKYQLNTEAHYKARNGWMYGFLDTATNKLFPHILWGDSATQTFIGPDGVNYAKASKTAPKLSYKVKPYPSQKKASASRVQTSTGKSAFKNILNFLGEY